MMGIYHSLKRILYPYIKTSLLLAILYLIYCLLRNIGIPYRAGNLRFYHFPFTRRSYSEIRKSISTLYTSHQEALRR